MTFDLDNLISECTSVIAESAPAKAVRDILTRVVSDPAAVTGALGVPELGEVPQRRDCHAVSGCV